MKKVMIFGTFDLLHRGHLDFIRQVQQYGDYLILVLARDETVNKLKGRWPVEDIDQRAQNLAYLNLIDKIIYGKLQGYYLVIKKEKPDVICLGYDQTYLTDQLAEKIKQYGLQTKIVRLKAYQSERYKTSLIR